MLNDCLKKARSFLKNCVGAISVQIKLPIALNSCNPSFFVEPTNMEGEVVRFTFVGKSIDCIDEKLKQWL